MLVLHLGYKATGLKKSLAIPGVAGIERLDERRNTRFRGRQHSGCGQCNAQPLVNESTVARLQDGVFVVFHQAVVLSVKNSVNRGKRNVFIAPAIACDEVAIQQLIVISACRLRHDGRVVGANRQSRVVVRVGQRAHQAVGVCHQRNSGRTGVVVMVVKTRCCAVGNVIQKGVVCECRTVTNAHEAASTIGDLQGAAGGNRG